MSIREVLLGEIRAQEPKDHSGPTLHQGGVLDATARKLGIINHPDLEKAVLTQWGELFRTGLLAWGVNLSNPNPPFFHLTERGRTALENLTRDPSNPAGYLRHLSSIAHLDAVAISYIREALDCYVAGLFKAAAVMVGGAAERAIVTVRDTTVDKLKSLGRSAPKDMVDWKIKTISDSLQHLFDGHKAAMPRELREAFEAYWSAFGQQIRTARNDVGHPESVDPVTPDTVHASLLIFPELARLARGLEDWVDNGLI
jgi:hypothetical protein